MRVTLLGTRGSVPAPGPDTAHFGGNTPSVEVRGDDGTVLVLDACGSGMGADRALSDASPRPTRKCREAARSFRRGAARGRWP